MNHTPYPAYVINLKRRTDRREYIIKEFNHRPEFNVQVIDACEHPIGSIGLWNSITKIISIANDVNEELVIIVEDDHQFTAAYSTSKLLAAIEEAKQINADLVSGGVSWFTGTIPCTKHLYWIEYFSGTQFLIIFRQFYKTLLDAVFNEGDDADYKICSLTNRRFFICPFISVQKDFGYSDATEKNDVTGRVESLFHYSSNGAQLLSNVVEFYKGVHPLIKNEMEEYAIESLSIPTYVINLPERKERRKHIEEQFKGRKEFDVTIVPACRHAVGAVGLWMSIREIIKTAIINDDDVIIICEDDHEFTLHYSKEVLLNNIIEAHYQQVDYLSGGSGKFGIALAISPNRVWTNYCYSAQFIVIFKKFFNTILDEPFDETIIGDMKLSDLTVNKMLFCPFISRQKDFGYSDVTDMHNANPGMVSSLFEESANRMLTIHHTYLNLKAD